MTNPDLSNFSCLIVFVLIPLSLVFALEKTGRLPILHIIDADVPFNALRDAINSRLYTLFHQFYGEDYVLPQGLRIEDVGEHIYADINNLATLQEIVVDLLFQGVQSPHFLNAVQFVLDFVT